MGPRAGDGRDGARAEGAEQLLAAAGLGEPAIAQVVQSIMEANESEIARSAASSLARPADPRRAAVADPSTPHAQPEQRVDDEPAAPPVTPTADADEAQGEPAEGGEPEPEQ